MWATTSRGWLAARQETHGRNGPARGAGWKEAHPKHSIVHMCSFLDCLRPPSAIVCGWRTGGGRSAISVADIAIADTDYTVRQCHCLPYRGATVQGRGPCLYSRAGLGGRTRRARERSSRAWVCRVACACSLELDLHTILLYCTVQVRRRDTVSGLSTSSELFIAVTRVSCERLYFDSSSRPRGGPRAAGAPAPP